MRVTRSPLLLPTKDAHNNNNPNKKAERFRGRLSPRPGKKENPKSPPSILEGWEPMEISRPSREDSSLRSLWRENSSSMLSTTPSLSTMMTQNPNMKNNNNNSLNQKLRRRSLQLEPLKRRNSPRRRRRKENKKNLKLLWHFWAETSLKLPSKMEKARRKRRKKRNRSQPNKNSQNKSRHLKVPQPQWKRTFILT